MVKVTDTISMTVTPRRDGPHDDDWMDFYSSDNTWIGDYFQGTLNITARRDRLSSRLYLKTFSCPDLASVITILNRISVD